MEILGFTCAIAFGLPALAISLGSLEKIDRLEKRVKELEARRPAGA